MEIRLMTTTVMARPAGEQLMVWGGDDLVEGLTDRILFSAGEASVRLTFEAREMVVGLQCGGASVRLRHDQRIELQGLPRFSLSTVGHLRWVLIADQDWQQSHTHDGIVPCAFCLQPYQRASQQGEVCPNLLCQQLLEQATWPSALMRFNARGEPFPDTMCQPWLKANGIG